MRLDGKRFGCGVVASLQKQTRGFDRLTGIVAGFLIHTISSTAQGADQQGEGQRQRSHGAGGQQERPEHPHSGDAAGAGAGAQLRGAVRRDLGQNKTGESE